MKAPALMLPVGSWRESMAHIQEKPMLSLELPTEVEQHFREVVQESYDGDIQIAVTSLLELHDKYGWKEQLREDVEAVRAEVRQQGGIPSARIQEAISTYRKQRHPSHA